MSVSPEVQSQVASIEQISTVEELQKLMDSIDPAKTQGKVPEVFRNAEVLQAIDDKIFTLGMKVEKKGVVKETEARFEVLKKSLKDGEKNAADKMFDKVLPETMTRDEKRIAVYGGIGAIAAIGLFFRAFGRKAKETTENVGGQVQKGVGKIGLVMKLGFLGLLGFLGFKGYEAYRDMKKMKDEYEAGKAKINDAIDGVKEKGKAAGDKIAKGAEVVKEEASAIAFQAALDFQYDALEYKDRPSYYRAEVAGLLKQKGKIDIFKHPAWSNTNDATLSQFVRDAGLEQKASDPNYIKAARLIFGFLKKSQPMLNAVCKADGKRLEDMKLGEAVDVIGNAGKAGSGALGELAESIKGDLTPAPSLDLVKQVTDKIKHSSNIGDKVNETFEKGKENVKSKLNEVITRNLLTSKDLDELKVRAEDNVLLKEASEEFMLSMARDGSELCTQGQPFDASDRKGAIKNRLLQNFVAKIRVPAFAQEVTNVLSYAIGQDEDRRKAVEGMMNRICSEGTIVTSDAFQLYYLLENGKISQGGGRFMAMLKAISILRKEKEEGRRLGIDLYANAFGKFTTSALKSAGKETQAVVEDDPEVPPELQREFKNAKFYFGDQIKDKLVDLDQGTGGVIGWGVRNWKRILVGVGFYGTANYSAYLLRYNSIKAAQNRLAGGYGTVMQPGWGVRILRLPIIRHLGGGIAANLIIRNQANKVAVGPTAPAAAPTVSPGTAPTATSSLAPRLSNAPVTLESLTKLGVNPEAVKAVMSDPKALRMFEAALQSGNETKIARMTELANKGLPLYRSTAAKLARAFSGAGMAINPFCAYMAIIEYNENGEKARNTDNPALKEIYESLQTRNLTEVGVYSTATVIEGVAFFGSVGTGLALAALPATLAFAGTTALYKDLMADAETLLKEEKDLIKDGNISNLMKEIMGLNRFSDWDAFKIAFVHNASVSVFEDGNSVTEFEARLEANQAAIFKRLRAYFALQNPMQQAPNEDPKHFQNRKDLFTADATMYMLNQSQSIVRADWLDQAMDHALLMAQSRALKESGQSQIINGKDGAGVPFSLDVKDYASLPKGDRKKALLLMGYRASEREANAQEVIALQQGPNTQQAKLQVQRMLLSAIHTNLECFEGRILNGYDRDRNLNRIRYVVFAEVREKLAEQASILLNKTSGVTGKDIDDAIITVRGAIPSLGTDEYQCDDVRDRGIAKGVESFAEYKQLRDSGELYQLLNPAIFAKHLQQ